MQYRRADLDRIELEYAFDSSNEQKKDKKYLTRWAALYNLLRTIPSDRRFNMNTWGEHDQKSACGTAACAAGHAVLHPWFRKRGIAKTAVHIDGVDRVLDFGNFEFFGSAWFPIPFNPTACEQALNIRPGTFLTPIMVSEVVRAYMLAVWSDKAVAAAIEATKTVKYDVDFIHRLLGWDKPLPSVREEEEENEDVEFELEFDFS